MRSSTTSSKVMDYVNHLVTQLTEEGYVLQGKSVVPIIGGHFLLELVNGEDRVRLSVVSTSFYGETPQVTIQYLN